MQSRPPRKVTGRFGALLFAWLLAWQSWGFALTAAGQVAAASCCCAHRNVSHACHCRTCTHARELASGEPRMKECASGSMQAPIDSVRPALPRVPSAAVPLPRPPLPEASPPLPFDPPDREVPTPPPLA